MHKAMAAAILAGLAWAANAAEQAQAPQRSITQVTGDIYRFQANQHYGVFMVTPQGVVLVDPIDKDTAGWVRDEIATRFNNAEVVQVLYSHHHWDHASGAAAFPGAKIVSRAETARNIQPPPANAKLGGGDAAADKNKDGLLQLDEVSGARAQNFAQLDKDGNGGLSARELFQAQFADVVAPTETYNTPVKRITLGGKTVEMHHLRSKHASDMSLVYFPAEKALFVVDVLALKRVFFRNMPDFDEADTLATLDRIESFDATTIVPGHGSVGARQDVRDIRQYLDDLMNGVQAGIVNGKTLQEIQTDLKLEKYAGWGGYADWRTLNIEGMYNYLTR